MYFEHLGRFNENIYLSDPGNMCTNKKSHDCDVVKSMIIQFMFYDIMSIYTTISRDCSL